MQCDYVLVESQFLRSRIPDVAIHAITQQRYISEIATVRASAALCPVQTYGMAISKIGRQGDAQQTALGSGVDRQIKRCSGNSSVNDVLYLARCFFQNKKVTIAEKCHASWLV